MRDNHITMRAIRLANHIIETDETIRETAKRFNLSRSTVHKDLKERLPEISPILANRVEEIMENHKAIRHLKGGKTTKEKFELLRQSG